MAKTSSPNELFNPTKMLGDFVQQALQKALANMRELAEAGYKAQADTFAVVSRRVQENIQELKTLLQPKT